MKGMSIYIYAKKTEDIHTLDNVIDIIRKGSDEIIVSVENKRCFRELAAMKEKSTKEDIIVVQNLNSLGLNDVDISNELNWFISKSMKLVIGDTPATYEYGVSQPMNQAVLTVVLQNLIQRRNNIVEMPRNKRSNSGRNKIDFPNNWDELFEKWKSKEISSKEFIASTGLKKATFYNLLTEYKEIQKMNDEYTERFKSV